MNLLSYHTEKVDIDVDIYDMIEVDIPYSQKDNGRGGDRNQKKYRALYTRNVCYVMLY